MIYIKKESNKRKLLEKLKKVLVDYEDFLSFILKSKESFKKNNSLYANFIFAQSVIRDMDKGICNYICRRIDKLPHYQTGFYEKLFNKALDISGALIDTTIRHYYNYQSSYTYPNVHYHMVKSIKERIFFLKETIKKLETDLKQYSNDRIS